MRIFFALVLLTSAVQAETISYSSMLTMPGSAVNNHIDLSGVFTIPEFDASLGTLNSINWYMNIFGGTTWTVLSRTYSNPYGDYSAVMDTAFLGTVAHFAYGPIFGGAGSICGIEGGNLIEATPCPDASGSLGAHASLTGTIGPSTASMSGDEYATYTINGPIPFTADMFVGNSEITLPIAMSLGGHWTCCANFGEMKTGRVSAGLAWTYDYTAAPLVTETPEPRYAGLILLAGLMGAAVYRRLGHVGALRTARLRSK